MKNNLLQDKSYQFAIRVVRLCQYLNNEKKEWVLSKQVLRSGTSIGSNVEEALGASSKKDFLYKLTISYKEARETSYWLRLLGDTGYINSNETDSLLKDIDSILRIIGSIQKTVKKKYKL